MVETFPLVDEAHLHKNSCSQNNPYSTEMIQNQLLEVRGDDFYYDFDGFSV
jgi:hypothetical protein